MDKLSASLLSTITLAFLHMLIPSHWLCFVVVGRAQGWRTRKTLAVTAAAGFVHVISTVLLGVCVLKLGERLLKTQEVLEHAGGFVLIALGTVYLILHLFHSGHHHEADRAIPSKAAFIALLFSLAASPCSVAIPFLVATSGSLPWIAFLSGVLLVTTVGGMMLLVGLTLLGIEKMQFRFFDRYEKLIIGTVLCALGGLIFVVHP